MRAHATSLQVLVDHCVEWPVVEVKRFHLYSYFLTDLKHSRYNVCFTELAEIIQVERWVNFGNLC